MSFLTGLGAAFQGQQDYEIYQRQRAADMQKQQFEAMRLQQARQEQMEYARQQEMRPRIDQNRFDILNYDGPIGRPPPMAAPAVPIQQDAPTPPAPGQASTPMVQPGAARQEVRTPGNAQATPSDDPLTRAMGDRASLQKEIKNASNARWMNPQARADQLGIYQQELRKIDSVIAQLGGGQQQAPQGMPPGGGMMNASMSGPQQGGMMPTGGQPQPQSAPTGPEPYKTMAGVGQTQPQGAAMVPNPPAVRPNSLSIQDAARILKAKGVTNPQEAMATLDSLRPYLNDEAKNEAAMYKAQHQQSTEELARMRYYESVRSHQTNEGERKNKDDQAGTWSLVTVDGKPMQMNSKTGEMRAAPGIDPTAKVTKPGTEPKPESEPLGSLSADAIEMAAKQMLLTGQLPPMGMGKAAAKQRAQVLNRAAVLAKEDGTTAADVQGNKAELRANAGSLAQLTKFNGMIGQFESTATKNADLALELAKGGAGTNYPTINKWINAVQTGTGKGDIVAFRNALETFKTEYAKIMSGATGSAGITDAARREADTLISVDMSPAQLEAAITTAKREMKNRRSSLAGEMEAARKDVRAVGKKPTDGSSTADADLINKYLK